MIDRSLGNSALRAKNHATRLGRRVALSRDAIAGIILRRFDWVRFFCARGQFESWN